VVAGVVHADRNATLVPARCVSSVRLKNVKLKMGKDTFKNAPRREPATTGQFPEALQETFRYFGIAAAGTRVEKEGEFLYAAKLLGQRLVGQANEPLGRIQDIFVDLAAGRVIYLVIEPAPGVGAPNQMYLVPPERVRPGSSVSELRLAFGAEHFIDGYHFPKEFPSDLSFPEVATAVYGHYGV